MTESLISGVDFVHVGTQDFDRAVEFYGTVLGLPESARYGRMPGAEFETGTLTLAVIQSDAFGLEFRPNTHRHRATRRRRGGGADRADVARGGVPRTTRSTAACATWPRSPTRTATR